MAELITMPKLGFDMAEGVFEEWAKSVGDEIHEGDVLAIIETDKASVEVTSFQTGVLRKTLVGPGDIVPVGDPIAVLGTADEAIDLAALGVGEAAPAAGAKEEAKAEAEPSPAPATAAPAAAAAAPAPAPEGRLLASPVAMRMAAELGIELRNVQGSGPDGRIIKRDIEAYVQAREKAPEVQPKPPIPTPSYEPTLEEYEAVPLSGMRKTIARRMVESKQQVPHIYLTLSIDMAAAMKLRKELNAYLDEDSRVSVNDMVVKASAIALRQFPNLNASFGGDELRLNKRVNVGIAVAREAGLLTVVIKDVDQKSLGQIGREARTLAGKAREGRMAVEDMMDGTFTVSNLGMFGIEDFVAIVNPPQAAILAVGTVQQVPVVDTDGQVAVGTRMKVTLSSDHRVTDGAESAQFLQALKKALEEPMRLLV